MPRVTTANYLGQESTQFAWATTDNDFFDREQDLYRLAQALELHTHDANAGKGLPISGTGALGTGVVTSLTIAPNAVTADKIAPNAVGTSELDDGAVTNVKIADGTIQDTKFATQKVTRAGDTMGGPLRISHTATPAIGTLYLGNTDAYLHINGANFTLNNPTVGGRFTVQSDHAVIRTGTPTTGYTFYGNGGAYLGYDGANMVVSGQPILTASNYVNYAVGVPIGGIISFLVATGAGGIPTDGRWQRETSADGRILIGAGTTFGQTFTQNTHNGANWTPSSGLSVSFAGVTVNGPVTVPENNVTAYALAAPGGGGGSFNAATIEHGHTNASMTGGTLAGSGSLTGASTAWIPPSLTVVYARRIA